MLELGWTPEQYESARRIGEHLQSCDECRQAQADYQAIQAPSRGCPWKPAEPDGGWSV